MECRDYTLSCQEKVGKHFIQCLKDVITETRIFLFSFAQESAKIHNHKMHTHKMCVCVSVCVHETEGEGKTPINTLVQTVPNKDH